MKSYAHKNSLLAEVNARSNHTIPTPYGGGIAIAITWFTGLTYLFFIKDMDSTLYYALLVGIIIAVVSYIDDLFELSPKIRLITQVIVAFLGLSILGGFNELTLFSISLSNPFITNIFSFLIIIWFINLYNFLDGIDGYAGSESVFLGISGFLIFGGDHFLILIVSVSGFLILNWHKAKIFMGDVGSTLLGYNIAIFTIYYANQEATNFWIWIILFEVFWFDATLTLFKRYKNGEDISKAHKTHAYQRLIQHGWSHSKVVKASIAINTLLLLSIYFFSNIYLILIISVVLLYIITILIDNRTGSVKYER